MKLRSIQLLRAIAILLVLHAHSIDLQMNFSRSFQQNFLHLQNFGGFGVDLFFVVSGFVISLAAEDYAGIRSGFRFLGKRFIRLNPVYYIASFFALMIVLWRAQTTGIYFPDGAILKTIFLLPLFDKKIWVDPLLDVGWTLAFEWLFYIQFFIAIIFAPQKKAWLVAALIVGMVLTGTLLKSLHPGWIFLTAPIQLEFLVGVIVYHIYKRYIPTDRATMIGGLCLLGAAAICLWLIFTGFGDDMESGVVQYQRSNFNRVLHWAAAAGLLVAGFVFREKGRPQKKPPAWLLLCGDASYSIYLTHTLVFQVMLSVYLRTGFPPAPDLVIFFQIALAILIGIVFYKWVETPVLRWLRAL